MKIWRFVLCVASLVPPGALAQSHPDLVEVDPIRCWWRTSLGAASVGQPFSLVLTCAVLESESVRVVPDESPLALASVQLAPFELLSGSHPSDLRNGQRRFFQYDYNVRLIDPTAIGRDVPLPALSIHYRVESKLQGQALEGRDRTYLLPAQSIHILSNVPADAGDIRDGSDAPFGAVEATRFRARLFDLGALALAAFGVILLVPAAVRAMGLTRTRRPRGAASVADRLVVRAAATRLALAQSEAGGGWDSALVARALTATRILAAYAIGQPVSQQPLTPNSDPGESRIPIVSGLVKRRRVSAASAVTAEDVSRALGRLPEHESPRRARLAQLRDALATLTRAQYAAEPTADSAITDAVRAAQDAAGYVRREHGWFATLTRRIRQR